MDKGLREKVTGYRTAMSLVKEMLSRGLIREDESKQIPESALVKIAEEIGMSRITGITAENGNRLIFHLSDGTDIEKTWLDRSRAESWTEDKRKEAAKASKARC